MSMMRLSVRSSQIISYTQKVGEYYQVFRATPVIPEPSTMGLILLGAMLGIEWRRRK